MSTIKRSRSIAALSALVGAALLVGTAPTQAATRSTVVIVEASGLTSLNPGPVANNIITNETVDYMTRANFWYFDNKKNVKRNVDLGSFKIVKNTAGDVRVTYTIKPGRVWSDGTPIDAVDLLLSHISGSSAYSKAASLGDPADKTVNPAFVSRFYNAIYDQNVVGDPVLGKDNLSLTVRYSKFHPDWEIIGPRPFPVHTLVQLADGQKALGTVAANKAAKAKFLAAYQNKDTATLKAIGKVWSTSYNTKNVDASTNPLLLVGSGGFLVKSAVADQSTTLVANPKYNAGPKLKGIKTVVLRYINNPTAAIQALANREVDVFQGTPTGDSVSRLEVLDGVKTFYGVSASYEHVDLRVGDAPGRPANYTGPFANSTNAAANAKAKDLRTAFLLALPRDEIVAKLIKPIDWKNQVVNSAIVLPDAKDLYAKVVKANGSSAYSAGTQEDRTAAALKLVQKHFPNASASNPVVKVNLLWGAPSNSRRADEARLIVAAAAKAGFDVNSVATPNLGSDRFDVKYDAHLYSWSPSDFGASWANAIYSATGRNNLLGYNNPTTEAALQALNKQLSAAQAAAGYAKVEKQVFADALALPLYQHPLVVGYTSGLKGVKPSAAYPVLVWNYWEWQY